MAERDEGRINSFAFRRQEAVRPGATARSAGIGSEACEQVAPLFERERPTKREGGDEELRFTAVGKLGPVRELISNARGAGSECCFESWDGIRKRRCG